MRKSFINVLIECFNKNKSIYLLVADIGFGLLDEITTKYPDRVINVGVAEQDMIGIATGLALSGKIVFCYSIANFPTLRCLEQIRNDACYHKSNVIIVAGGCGLGYGALGMTHHATEDLAIMRSFPNMTIVAPADPIETSFAVKEMTKGIGTCYLRLGWNEPNISECLNFKIGKATTFIGGFVDANIITTGTMLHTALEASKILDKQGIKLGVINMHTIKPLDNEAIISALESSPNIFTLEEHSLIGGLGSAVSEVLAETGKRFKFKRFGIADNFAPVGNYEYLLKHYKLTVEDIVRGVKDVIR